MKNAPTLARSVAPEDIVKGMRLMVLHEVLVCLFVKDLGLGAPEVNTVPVRWVPANGQKPVEVVSVCLPFVLVKPTGGKRETFDTRLTQFARVDEGFAERAAKRDKPKKKRRKKSRKSKKKCKAK